MREYSISLKEKFRRLDPVLLISVLLMNIMSIVLLASMSADQGSWYVLVQLLASAVSIVAMFVIAFLDYDAYFPKLKIAFFIATIVLIVITIIFGRGSNGNGNWISIGRISVQPTEIAKSTFIVCFALHLGYVRDKINKPLSVLQLILHVIIVVGLMLLQGDTGMAIIYLAVAIMMVFCAGLSVWYIIGIAVTGVALAPLIWTRLSNRQQMRILAGFNPDLDPTDAGYQAIQSRNAIISGGFRGAGFSGGTQYKSIFGKQSDFIFSVLAEKFGFLGTLLYLVLISIVIIRILWLSAQVKKKYASYICYGVAAMLIAQTIENIGMCLAILPVIGITLPFLSYGPSSIITMYICIGIVQSICVHNNKLYFERDLE